MAALEDSYSSERGEGVVMRYSPLISSKLAIVRKAADGQYRFVMLGLMIVEVALLLLLVIVEMVHR